MNVVNDTLGLILAENRTVKMNELTDNVRAESALPFGSNYRLIDFVLSSMVNSGIINVGVATHINYSSLMDHLGNGAPWDLSRKDGGLFILPPYLRGEAIGINEGNVDILHGVLTYLQNNTQKYVVLAEGNKVCNMTFNDAIEQHKTTGADVTVIYNDVEKKDVLSRSTVYEVDDDMRVTSVSYASQNPKSKHCGMSMYIVDRIKLEEIIDEAYAQGSHDFIRDIILKNVNSMKIYGYKYSGFVASIDSVKSYYDANMLMIDENVRHELFAGENLIYTKVKDNVPTRYYNGSSVKKSILGDGCSVRGEIENCVIFRNVEIGKGTVIKNSIIMQNTRIGNNCYIENAVIDKECVVGDGKRLIGALDYPAILPKSATV